MKYPAEFDSIRCYLDEDVTTILPQLIAQPEVSYILASLLGEENTKKLVQKLQTVNTITDFQATVFAVILHALAKKTTAEVCLLGKENIPQQPSLFLTNHRNIICDPALLNMLLFDNGMATTQIAIGNNLLIQPWIEMAVRLNKCFLVKRDGGVREQLLISKNMSEYIRQTLSLKGDSIWMAHREGRAKNSDDRTAPAIIKMLNMSGEGSFVEKLRALSIVPIAINYEFDPADFLKAKEMQQKRDDAAYKKSPMDDMLNMKADIMGYKGRVAFAICPPLQVPDAWNELPRTSQADTAASAIDALIHANYQLFPNNYAAADLLTGTDTYSSYYTLEDKQRFMAYIDGQVQKVDLPNRDDAFLQTKLYEMYANPVFNQQKALAQ